MGNAITVRLDEETAEWLAEAARKSGVSQGKIIRDQLARLRQGKGEKPFMRWAGSVAKPADLSSRKGFAKK